MQLMSLRSYTAPLLCQCELNLLGRACGVGWVNEEMQQDQLLRQMAKSEELPCQPPKLWAQRQPQPNRCQRDQQVRDQFGWAAMPPVLLGG